MQRLKCTPTNVFYSPDGDLYTGESNRSLNNWGQVDYKVIHSMRLGQISLYGLHPTSSLVEFSFRPSTVQIVLGDCLSVQ